MSQYNQGNEDSCDPSWSRNSYWAQGMVHPYHPAPAYWSDDAHPSFGNYGYDGYNACYQPYPFDRGAYHSTNEFPQKTLHWDRNNPQDRRHFKRQHEEAGNSWNTKRHKLGSRENSNFHPAGFSNTWNSKDYKSNEHDGHARENPVGLEKKSQKESTIAKNNIKPGSLKDSTTVRNDNTSGSHKDSTIGKNNKAFASHKESTIGKNNKTFGSHMESTIGKNNKTFGSHKESTIVRNGKTSGIQNSHEITKGTVPFRGFGPLNRSPCKGTRYLPRGRTEDDLPVKNVVDHWLTISKSSKVSGTAANNETAPKNPLPGSDEERMKTIKVTTDRLKSMLKKKPEKINVTNLLSSEEPKGASNMDSSKLTAQQIAAQQNTLSDLELDASDMKAIGRANPQASDSFVLQNDSYDDIVEAQAFESSVPQNDSDDDVVEVERPPSPPKLLIDLEESPQKEGYSSPKKDTQLSNKTQTGSLNLLAAFGSHQNIREMSADCPLSPPFVSPNSSQHKLILELQKMSKSELKEFINNPRSRKDECTIKEIMKGHQAKISKTQRQQAASRIPNKGLSVEFENESTVLADFAIDWNTLPRELIDSLGLLLHDKDFNTSDEGVSAAPCNEVDVDIDLSGNKTAIAGNDFEEAERSVEVLEGDSICSPDIEIIHNSKEGMIDNEEFAHSIRDKYQKIRICNFAKISSSTDSTNPLCTALDQESTNPSCTALDQESVPATCTELPQEPCQPETCSSGDHIGSSEVADGCISSCDVAVAPEMCQRSVFGRSLTDESEQAGTSALRPNVMSAPILLYEKPNKKNAESNRHSRKDKQNQKHQRNNKLVNKMENGKKKKKKKKKKKWFSLESDDNDVLTQGQKVQHNSDLIKNTGEVTSSFEAAISESCAVQELPQTAREEVYLTSASVACDENTLGKPDKQSSIGESHNSSFYENHLQCKKTDQDEAINFHKYEDGMSTEVSMLPIMMMSVPARSVSDSVCNLSVAEMNARIVIIDKELQRLVQERIFLTNALKVADMRTTSEQSRNSLQQQPSNEIVNSDTLVSNTDICSTYEGVCSSVVENKLQKNSKPQSKNLNISKKGRNNQSKLSNVKNSTDINVKKQERDLKNCYVLLEKINSKPNERNMKAPQLYKQHATCTDERSIKALQTARHHPTGTDKSGNKAPQPSRDHATGVERVIKVPRPVRHCATGTHGKEITVYDDILSDSEMESINPSFVFDGDHSTILDIKIFENFIFAASQDGYVYIYLFSDTLNGFVHRLGQNDNGSITCIAFDEVQSSSCDLKLFAGTANGWLCLYTMKNDMMSEAHTNRFQISNSIQCIEINWGFVFCGTKAGCVVPFNIENKSIKEPLCLGGSPVLCIKSCMEGPRRVLVVSSRNQPIEIRDAMSGLLLRSICGLDGSVTVYSLLLTFNVVFCGTNCENIFAFNFQNGERTFQLKAGKGIVCMKLLYGLLFASCYDSKIYIFDTVSRNLISSFQGPGNMVLCLDVNDNMIICASKNKQLCSYPFPPEVKEFLKKRKFHETEESVSKPRMFEELFTKYSEKLRKNSQSISAR